MCQGELSLDAKSLNARLTRLEEQLRTGEFVITAKTKPDQAVPADDDVPPPPDDMDAPPEEASAPADPQPVGFWTDLVAAVRPELSGPASGFLTTNPNAPVQGILQGNTLILRCNNSFTQGMVEKPEIISVVARKASSMLQRQITVKTQDASAAPMNNQKMDQLLTFGRTHPDLVNIKK